jgi:hypothetical protein
MKLCESRGCLKGEKWKILVPPTSYLAVSSKYCKFKLRKKRRSAKLFEVHIASCARASSIALSALDSTKDNHKFHETTCSFQLNRVSS